MGCWHRCGSYRCVPYFHDWPPEPRWDPYDYEDWRAQRRPARSRGGQSTASSTAERLEARLASLRVELERVEASLAELRASGEEVGQP
jgi:uncharacterized small protein (DUF1192 family)